MCAGVVKLADATDSNPLVAIPCRFESGNRHHYPSRLTRAFSRKDFPCTTTPSPCAVHPRASRRPGGSPFPCRALAVRQVLLSAPLPQSFDSGFFTIGLSLHDDSVALLRYAF